MAQVVHFALPENVYVWQLAMYPVTPEAAVVHVVAGLASGIELSLHWVHLLAPLQVYVLQLAMYPAPPTAAAVHATVGAASYI